MWYAANNMCAICMSSALKFAGEYGKGIMSLLSYLTTWQQAQNLWLTCFQHRIHASFLAGAEASSTFCQSENNLT